MSRKYFLCTLLVLIGVFATIAYAGKIELTTYYPAPHGEYRRLSSTEGANFATTSGNVGIGTLNPLAKLDVNGGALIQGLTIGQGGLPDSTNTAIGNQALFETTAGCAGCSYNNTAVGSGALLKNKYNNNTAVGYQALSKNITGSLHTAVGTQALFSLSQDYVNANTAVGYQALYTATSGGENVAVGQKALFKSTFAGQNVAVGSMTLLNATSGSTNTAIGTYALSALTTGANNIAIGFNAGADSAWNVITTQDNQVVIGNSATAGAHCKVAWDTTSDARDKTDFAPVPHGLDFVSQLKPVAFQFRTSRKDPAPIKDGKVRYGFLAQDILPLEGEHPVVIDKRDPEHLKYDESSLIPVLVKAIQEQQKGIEQQKQQLDLLEKEVAELKRK